MKVLSQTDLPGELVRVKFDCGCEGEFSDPDTVRPTVICEFCFGGSVLEERMIKARNVYVNETECFVCGEPGEMRVSDEMILVCGKTQCSLQAKSVKTVKDVGQEVDGIIRDNYSWDGTGRKCWGIDVSDNPIRVIEKCAKRGLTNASIDRLGLGHIVYWKGLAGN